MTKRVLPFLKPRTGKRALKALGLSEKKYLTEDELRAVLVAQALDPKLLKSHLR